MDIQPINPGHVLIIPNNHIARFGELDEETGAHLFKLAIRISKILPNTGLRFEGLDVLIPDGEGAGQEVYHTHLHIFPRFKGDGFGLKFGPDYAKLPDRAELDKVAEQIKAALSA